MSSSSSMPSCSSNLQELQPDLHKHNSLVACLTEGFLRDDCEGTCAMKIIQNGADIHQVVNRGETFLHLAVKAAWIDVVELLIEKGIDVNAQDQSGSTALHLACSRRRYKHMMEAVPMLLYYGADPWICDEDCNTPFDLIVCFNDDDDTLHTTIEHLYRYMFDGIEKSDIQVDTLLSLASSDVPFFYEMVQYINVEVSRCDCETARKLLAISPKYLQILIDEFDCVLQYILGFDEAGTSKMRDIEPESVYFLFSSSIQPECSNWICQVGFQFQFVFSLCYLGLSVPEKENLIFYLLSYGLIACEDDLQTVKDTCGYNALLGFYMHLDLREETNLFKQLQRSDLLIRILRDVGGNLETRIRNRYFWICRDEVTRNREAKAVLPYYALPELKRYRNMFWNDDVAKKIQDQPQIPLLVELARSVFRRYFVQRFKITTAKHFYSLLYSLPISTGDKKIITLETVLY